MNKKQIIKEYKKNYHIYNNSYSRIDSNIQPLVDWFRKQGFITFASCGSHIFDYDGKPISSGQAYVAFYYTEHNKERLNDIMKHNFPKSKYYEISWFDFEDSRMSLDIIFLTRYNRIHYLKKIYDDLGVKYSEDMKLEKCRPGYKVLESQGKTIYKSIEP